MTTYLLVDRLSRAAAKGDRATLAALRRGWSNPLALYPIVAPFLPQSPTRRQEEASLVLARLFGEHPFVGSAPLGTALRSVVDARASASVESRFSALLAAPFEDAPSHLRHLLALLARELVGLDWHDLFFALLRWDEPDARAQRRWAVQFWGSHATQESADAQEVTDTETTEENAP
jgi:CRISPR type I-E-associated protein CasB/Cse2